MKKLIIKNNRAFTLVETLVALSIFSVSLLGLISVLAKGISDTSYIKEKDTAIYLAQEGIEYMRNMRDTYVLYDSGGPLIGWTNFNTKLSNNSCATSNGCYFNADSLSGTMASLVLGSCSSGNCPTMSYNSSTGKYGYTGTTSVFTRKIAVQPGTNETKILSTVYWTQGSGTRSITLSESLFNWVE